MREQKQNRLLTAINGCYSLVRQGASININSGLNAPKVGYMVGKQSLGVFNAIAEVNVFMVLSEAKQHITGSNAEYIGVWTDTHTGKVYFDLSEWVESLDKALSIGAERGEIAIWDLSNNKEIRI